MAVTVTFTYEPDDPDDGDRTGMSMEEHDSLTEALMALGADNIEIERKD
jgi:hypothetical protein